MLDLLSQSLGYLDFIRGKDCLICGKPGEPDHLEEVGMGNSRKKLSYRHLSAVPLCRLHHDLRHKWGTYDFEGDHSLNVYREALSLFIEYLSGTAQPFFRDKG